MKEDEEEGKAQRGMEERRGGEQITLEGQVIRGELALWCECVRESNAPQ